MLQFFPQVHELGDLDVVKTIPVDAVETIMQACLHVGGLEGIYENTVKPGKKDVPQHVGWQN